jgi:hypothetical protein
MTTIVIMPGGFHPYHAGHHALYQSAQRAFPDAEVFVAATNDTSSRPFPFAVKEKLAKLAGVEAGHFVQVKSPFRAEEITSRFDPQRDVLIFVRSEKDAGSQPQPGGVKKDGSPSYLQPLLGAQKLEPFSKHAYMAYLPTVEFGPGMTSATQIRGAWPTLNEKRKTALVMSLYPVTQKNPKLAATVVKLLDAAIGTDSLNEFAPGDGDDGESPLDDYPCYDCGSTIFLHHTRLCDFAEDNAIRDLPAEPGTQYWTGRVPKGLKPIPGLNKGVEETVSANGTIANTSGAGAGMTASYQRRENQPVDEGWKDVVAGGAMALGALGANAQSMPNINAQQVELTNKYYKVLVQRAVEDGRTLDARTKNFLMAKAQDAAAQKIQKSTAQSPTTQAKPQFPSQGSEQRRAKDFDQFESQDYLDERRL